MAKWTYDGTGNCYWSPFKRNDDATSYHVIVTCLNAGEEAKAEIERLKAELAKAKDEADARVVAVCDEISVIPMPVECASKVNSILGKHRPKPKFVWKEIKDGSENFMYVLQTDLAYSVWQTLRNNKIEWFGSMVDGPFDTAELAKAAVERCLCDMNRRHDGDPSGQGDI